MVRNDFVGCMIELRKAGKEAALGDVKCAKSANSGEAFSKLQQILLIGY
jgi:hypothetical protein